MGYNYDQNAYDSMQFFSFRKKQMELFYINLFITLLTYIKK